MKLFNQIKGSGVILTLWFLVALVMTESGFSQNAGSIKIGDFIKGGIVFFVDSTGEHGLVCALKDQARSIFWTDAKMKQNTENENNPDPSAGTTRNENSQSLNLASQLCSELIVKNGNEVYDDWYLPSKEEVSLMYKNRELINKTARLNSGSPLTLNEELSPLEHCNSPEWELEFNYCYKDYDHLNRKCNVRAVRAF